MDSTLDTEVSWFYDELPKGAPRSTWAAVVEWIIKGIPLESIPDLQRVWPTKRSRRGESWNRRGKHGVLKQFETD